MFDGSMADLYQRLTHSGESAVVHEAVPAGASILELGCGTGRMTRRLLELGHSVTAVDNDSGMLSHVPTEAEKVLGHIETLNLAAQYPVVLLASNLINHLSQPFV
jgi:16S rRNA A1518/A1519 N6-dimethyltransferase RsmA/KsgA/DIM1 with predicted DNA glycosylase/AP lyase activity